ncbi:hypothetical protein HK099_002084 [Clydaea vesicula]|uniref:SH3 domain-containing protein n=1 Tax=Clydaea vesicula TaxID=447962 RepID=A0AAD5U2Y7_9FUNG|nr:hypothetical protein HK099_002084 [Clydaea vesicula]
MKQHLITVIVLLAIILTQSSPADNDCQVLNEWAPTIFNNTDCCSVGTSVSGVVINCNPESRVISLSMLNGALPKGSKIPLNIGELKFLSWLDINTNGLVGELPDSFYNLTSLTSLNLENNNFQGIFPDLSTLKSLNDCALTGLGPVCLKEGISLPAICISFPLPQCKSNDTATTTITTGGKESKETSPNSGILIGSIIGGIALLSAMAIILIVVKKKKSNSQRNQKKNNELGNNGYFFESKNNKNNHDLLKDQIREEVNWVATEDYQRTLDDELDVNKGDHIEVQAFYTDGWVLGVNKRTGFQGNVALTLLTPLK